MGNVKTISVSVGNRAVIINNEKISFDPKMKGKSISIVNGVPYVDGYEYKDKKWKLTLKALYHKFF